MVEISGRFAKRAFIQHRLLVNQLIHLRRRTQLADVVGNAIGTRGGLAQEFFLANLVGRGEGAPSTEPPRATWIQDASSSNRVTTTLLNYFEQVVTIADQETGPERKSAMTHGAMAAPDADAMDLSRAARLAWVEPAPDEDTDRLTVGADPDGASRVGEKGRRTHVFDL